ncbi:OprD family porin [Pseudomonas sp. Q1-7]|uniref:OprD family porin n=1 Tax=Pseudomonas sp. Q1-7 TaxID=3020843 RepID=UPI0023002827|nr:OprD family porin [Pseudomonas sp. Q1-7]
MTYRFLLGAALCCASLGATAGQADARGFVEDSHLDLLNRNYYFNRDFRHGAANGLGSNAGKPLAERNGYREEWAHGIMATYRSGFTRGTLGLGLDAHAMLGLKLDSGAGRTGTSLLPVDRDGEPRDDYGTLGGALKLRLSNTVLKYGEMLPEVPVFAASQARLLPSMATGFSLVSDELAGLNLQAGHFTRTRGVDSSNSDGELTTDYAVLPTARSVSYVGGTWTPDGRFNLSLYTSELEDIWRQHYAAAKYRIDLARGRALTFAFNLYDTHDSGAARGGEIDNTAWSLTATYAFGPHSFLLGRQVVDGDEPLDWIGFDRTQGGSLFMGNVGQVVTFSEANERSWQARYDLDMAAFGVPGLSLMTRYIRGDGMDNASSENPFYTARFVYDPAKDNKHWERNLEVRYVVQSGPARNLSLRLRQSTHRGTTGYRYPDHDEVRLIVEYPLSLF